MPRTLVGEPIQDKKRLSALILEEFDPRYNRHSIELTEGDYEIGEVITDATLGDAAVGAGPTFTDALLCENIVVPAGKTYEVAALVRGPALVNLDEVVRTTNETDANLIIRLADLISQGIRFVREPAFQTESPLGS